MNEDALRQLVLKEKIAPKFAIYNEADDEFDLYKIRLFNDALMKTRIATVPKPYVISAWDIIKRIPICPEVYRDDFKFSSQFVADRFTWDYEKLVMTIMNYYDIKEETDRDKFNGGRHRSKYYFKYYYYPIKVLQVYGNIHYTRKGIQRLNAKATFLKQQIEWETEEKSDNIFSYL